MKKLLLLAILYLIHPYTVDAARLYTTGFELQSNTSGIEFTTNGLTTGGVQTATKRSGSASMRINATGAESSWIMQQFRSADGSGKGWMRAYINIADCPASTNFDVASFWSSTVDRVAGIEINSSCQLIVTDDAGSTVGSASSALSTGSWYCVELEYTPGTGTAVYGGYVGPANTDTVSGCVGESTANAFARTTSGTGANFARTYIGTAQTSDSSYDVYIDDIAINDTTGSSQTGNPDAGKIVYLRPNASGDSAPSGCGNTSPCGDSNEWNRIDEVTPNDATDFIDMDTAINADFNMDNSSTPGIGSSDTITLVDVGIRIREEASAATSYALRIKSASGGTVTSTTAADIGTTAWRTNPTGGNNNMLNRLVSYTDPTTGTAWTPTGTNSLDNMQLGVGMTTGTAGFDVSALWAEIEYVPASGGSGASTYYETSVLLFE